MQIAVTRQNTDRGTVASLGRLVLLSMVFAGAALAMLPGSASAFTEVTELVDVRLSQVKQRWMKRDYYAEAELTNLSDFEIDGPIRLVILGFKNQRISLDNPDGITDDGYPYVVITADGDALNPGDTGTADNLLRFVKVSGKFDRASNGLHRFTRLRNFPIKLAFRVDADAAVEPPPPPPPTDDAEVNLGPLAANPGSILLPSEPRNVCFTTSLLSNTSITINSVLLNNLTVGTEMPLNDDGFACDEEPGDGIYSGEVFIGPADFGDRHCMTYAAMASTDVVKDLQSDDFLLCASPFPNLFAASDTRDKNLIKYGDALVVADEILVHFEPGFDISKFARAVKDHGLAIVGSVTEDGAYQVRFPQKPLDPNCDKNDICDPRADRLKDWILQIGTTTEGLVAINPNYAGFFTAPPNDAVFQAGEQHGLELVTADNLNNDLPRYIWDARNAVGRLTKVLVIDSGVAPEHPENLNPLAETADDMSDDLGHGTRMAGIIGAETNNQIGIAAITRRARVRSIKMSNNGVVTLTKMLTGFQRALNHAGRNSVVSASFSVSNMLSDGGVCRKIRQIIRRGSMVVVAAGNDNNNADAGIVPGNCNSPAFDPFTDPRPLTASDKHKFIVVGASSCTAGACEADTRWQQSASVGSNFGSWVDISAPGVNIPTTANDGGFVSITGTSAATALVAGGVAVLRGCHVGGHPQGSSTEPLNLNHVSNALLAGATTSVAGLPNRMNLYASLASVNTGPVGIALSNDQVDENTDTSGGFTVGLLTPDDATVCDRQEFAITGGADAASFSIRNDDALVIDDGVLDFESQQSYNVRVTVTDFYGQSFDQNFTIAVNDLIEIP